MYRLIACLFLLLATTPVLAQSSLVNPELSARISDLEAELARSLETSDESAQAMLELIDVYSRIGDVFGLIRVTSRFSSVQIGHPEHARISLVGIDSYKAASQHPPLQVACRQFLDRYPEDELSSYVWRTLAESLAITAPGNPLPIAEAFANAWRSSGKKNVGDAVGAMRFYEEHNSPSSHAAAAEIANALVPTLGSTPLAAAFAEKGFEAGRRAGEPGLAISLGEELLKLPHNITRESLSVFHKNLGDLFVRQKQPLKAIAHFQTSIDLSPSPETSLALAHASATAKQTPEQVGAFVRKIVAEYPGSKFSHDGSRILAERYVEHGDLKAAIRVTEQEMARGALSSAYLSAYLGWLDQQNTPPSRTVSTLRKAASAHPPGIAWRYRWVIAFDLYRDRMSSQDKAVDALRELLFEHPADDASLGGALNWLLDHGGALDDDVSRYLEVASSLPHFTHYGQLLGGWIKNAERHDETRKIAAQVKKRYETYLNSPATKLWRQSRGRDERASSKAMSTLLSGTTLTNEQRRLLLGKQAYYFRHRVGNNDRPKAVPLYQSLAILSPESFEIAAAWLECAVSNGSPEQAQEAAENVLGRVQNRQADGYTFGRLAAVAAAKQDERFGRKVVDWISSTESDHGLATVNLHETGLQLSKAGMPDAALAYWRSHLPVAPDSWDTVRCASSVLGSMDPEAIAARASFISRLLKAPSNNHGAYASWLADLHFKSGDIDAFESVLADARKTQDSRPFRPWGFGDHPAGDWVRIAADMTNDWDQERRIRVLRSIQAVNAGRSSIVAELALFDLSRSPDGAGLNQLVSCYEATRRAGRSSTSWDWVRPFAQRCLGDGRFAQASALYSGLIHNIGSVGSDQIEAARKALRTAYTNMGSMGMRANLDASVAPLMEIGLHLRLGDEAAAAKAYRENRAIFDTHRSEVPIEILTFAASVHIDEGTEESLNLAEEILREWVVSNSDKETVSVADKARVQLLLGRLYFEAQRYDVARAEFTTVVNQFPESASATEATFGIGETFLDQKVYEEAEAVFSELAQSPLPRIRVRAQFLRGVLAVKRGDREGARNIFRQVLQSMPDANLADRTLFELAEVYGLEKRYLDQLQLLRTVGRIGRSSKRWHVPGRALSVVVQDVDLGISRGGGRVPVVVTALPGGDSELLQLSSGGAGKGLFIGEISTALGASNPEDGTLQVLGGDTITVGYPEGFIQDFAQALKSSTEIRIASDAQFDMGSALSADRQDDAPAPREMGEELELQLRAEQRPESQIKPGNQIYLRVADPDRSLSDEIDHVSVKLTASSGDEVSVRLQETGSVSGVFTGSVPTGDLPAGATASDTSAGHSPLMAIDRDPGSAWRSEPDGAAPKFLDVDMKDLFPVDEIVFSSPSGKTQSPVRFSLLGSHDGRFFYPLAEYPQPELVEMPKGIDAAMHQRVLSVGEIEMGTWEAILALDASNEGDRAAVEQLAWPDIARQDRTDNLKGKRAVLWKGLYSQPRSGAVRFEMTGHQVALMIDGHSVISPSLGEQSVDVFLQAGAHRLFAFATLEDAQTDTASLLRAREDPNTATVRLAQFDVGDFPSPEGNELAPAFQLGTVTTGESEWEIKIPKRDLRHLRIRVDEFTGQSVAINSIAVRGDGMSPIPPEEDLLALSSNDVLEISPGDSIDGVYIDQFTEGGIGRNRPITKTMSATYHDGQVLAVSSDFQRGNNGGVSELRKEILRIDPGERVVIEVVDYDCDTTGKQDEIQVTASLLGSDESELNLKATETGPSTGVFRAEFETVAKGDPAPTLPYLTLSGGDTVYLSYLDQQNTFPGNRIRRDTPIFVREPTDAEFRIIETRFEYASDPSGASSVPREGVETILPASPPVSADSPKSVAYQLPLTITVVDPDAARDTRSTVTVEIVVGDASPITLNCQLSRLFAPDNPSLDGFRNPALYEGRFVGQILLELGTADSPSAVPRAEKGDAADALLGSVELQPSLQRQLQGVEPLVPVLNLTGSAVVTAAYRDVSRTGSAPPILADHAQLVSDAILESTTAGGDPLESPLRIGERLYIRLTDQDLDLSAARDVVTVVAVTSHGEKEALPLEETLAHSGVFTGSFLVGAKATPTAGNFRPEAPELEADFGVGIELRYADQRPPDADAEKVHIVEVPVANGSDGIVSAFSKNFEKENLAIQTQFHIAESYFELFKGHRELGRKPEAEFDLATGRRILEELRSDYPLPKYAPRVSYLLGQFSQELEDWGDAVGHYESIIRDYPDNALAADAQFKLGQCYEESGRFDEALDAYVVLAATFPESPLIASVMIRITDRFYKQEDFLPAAGVGEKFLQKFSGHQWASRIAFRVGQSYYKAEEFEEGGEAFDRFSKNYPDDELAAQALFWAGESYRMANNVPEAFRRYNRCRWDYPESDAAKYSRGRLALPEMLAQFEREAQLDDEP